MSRISDNVTDSGTCCDLSYFISSSPWSSKEVMKLTRTHAIRQLGTGGSILIDEIGQQKYGPTSVGTSHQYLGKNVHTCNAEVGVFASYCVGNLSTLIDYQLFLPKSWVKDREKSLNAKVPPNIWSIKLSKNWLWK